jgi:hypothetical protein
MLRSRSCSPAMAQNLKSVSPEHLEPVLNINKRLLQVLDFCIHRPKNNRYFFNTQCHIGDEEINSFASNEQRFNIAIMK